MFPPHVQPEHVQYGLEQGILVEGVVRINPKNYKDAFISSPSGITADILVIIELKSLICNEFYNTFRKHKASIKIQ